MLNGKYDIVALVTMRTNLIHRSTARVLAIPLLPKGNEVLFSHFICRTAYAMTSFGSYPVAFLL